MERMRQRVEQDPYEAVFGKRFEPFWSPLVPSWMREEMGLKKKKEAAKAAGLSPSPDSTTDPTADLKHTVQQSMPPKEATVLEAKPASDLKQSGSYAYASTTSYNSWTQKTRRTEWDSDSNQRREFEYDPVSNRMVPVDAPTESKPFPSFTDPDGNPRTRLDSEAVNVPVRQYNAVKTPTHIVQTQSAQKPNPSSSTEASAHSSSSRNSSKPSALARMPEQDLDFMTADSVRASVGKTKPAAALPSNTRMKVELERAFESNLQKQNLPDGSPRAKRVAPVTKKMWDQAELVWQNENELRTLRSRKKTILQDASRVHRHKGELERIDRKMQQLTDSIRNLESNTRLAQDNNELVKTQEFYYNERAKKREAVKEAAARQPRLETSLERTRTGSTNKAVGPMKGLPLVSAIERMQAKSPRRIVDDPDDSAAHESTEPVQSKSHVPKEWQKQTDILQGDRIERTAGKNMRLLTKSTDDMEAHKAAYEQKKAIEKPQVSGNNVREAKADAKLQAEIDALKAAYAHHDNHYTRRAKSTTVSSTQGQTVPQKVQSAGSRQELKELQGEGDWCPNITNYADSSKWYKQPAIDSKSATAAIAKATQKTRDQQLVNEVRNIYEKRYGLIDVNHQQPAEPSKRRQTEQEDSLSATQKSETSEDEHLVKVLAMHEQPDTYSFKDDNLAATIAAKDEEAVRNRSIMRPESASKMREVIAEGLEEHCYSTESAKREDEDLDEHSYSAGIHKAKLVDDEASKLIPVNTPTASALSSDQVKNASTQARSDSIEWEEPPVYKVLAYDSGNDKCSTATTTSNFTGTETPISIPQALSQLYRPARFVSHFASLQKEGYQVIYGTRDLLVFKLVKIATPSVKPSQLLQLESAENNSPGAAAVHDHARVNPVDGMSSSRPKVEPSTGNFASPTGFVNHDPVITENTNSRSVAVEASRDARTPEAAPQQQTQGLAEQAGALEEESIRHYPRVKREEAVFSGSDRKWNNRQNRHHGRRSGARFGEKRNRALKWALSVAAGTVGLTYVVGVVAESARKDSLARGVGRKVLAGEKWDEIAAAAAKRE